VEEYRRYLHRGEPCVVGRLAEDEMLLDTSHFSKLTLDTVRGVLGSLSIQSENSDIAL